MVDVIALIKEVGHEEGIEEGIKRGRQEGREEGREEGIRKGIKRGEYQAKLATAQNLLEMGLSIEQIAKATGLSFEDVAKIERESKP